MVSTFGIPFPHAPPIQRLHLRAKHFESARNRLIPCIFLSFRSCSCKDHLGFPLCYIKRNVCPKHFTGFKNNHQTNELCEFQRLSLGGLPSALRLLSILPLFLLSFLLSLKTNKHLLKSDFEIVHPLSHVSDSAQTLTHHKKCSGEYFFHCFITGES